MTSKPTTKLPNATQNINNTPKPKPPDTTMLKGASLLISLQLTSRLLTFTFNQLLLRLLTAPLLGLSAQLETYYLSILFFARESLRVAIQRQEPSSSSSSSKKLKGDDEKKSGNESQVVVNLGYLAIPLGLLISPLLGFLYMVSLADSSQPYLALSVKLYALAAMMELCSEPCFVLMQTRLEFGTRATAESAATFLRCGVVYATAVYGSKNGLELGVLPFALGQVVYGMTLMVVYTIAGYKTSVKGGFSMMPIVFTGDDGFVGGLFDRPTMSLAKSMMTQSLVKHLLTQGDTFLISLLATPDVQGVYALANNYGGLLARLVFQPVEETSRSYFSRLLVSTKSSQNVVKSEKAAAAATSSSSGVEEAKKSLLTLLRLYGILSTIIISFGPYASPSLIALVAGSRWAGSGAGQVLAAYCFYIPFLAINGIMESFVASVATEQEVHQQSVWMSIFSGIFAATAFLTMRLFGLGAVGLVVANAVNMLCRIFWSWWFIDRWFEKHQGQEFEFKPLYPKSIVVMGIATSRMMTFMGVGREPEEEPLRTLASFGATAVPLLMIFLFLERKFLLEIVQSLRNRKTSE